MFKVSEFSLHICQRSMSQQILFFGSRTITGGFHTLHPFPFRSPIPTEPLAPSADQRQQSTTKPTCKTPTGTKCKWALVSEEDLVGRNLSCKNQRIRSSTRTQSQNNIENQFLDPQQDITTKLATALKGKQVVKSQMSTKPLNKYPGRVWIPFSQKKK